MKLIGWPSVAFVVGALVTAGTWLTTSVKFWLVVPAELVAVMVSG